MKATLEFTLPEERMEHLHALNGIDHLSILHKIDDLARSLLKHGETANQEQVIKTLESIRALMPEEL
jgi:hypothetical protein